MKKKIIIICLIVLIIIAIIFFIIYNRKEVGSEDISSLPIDYNEVEENVVEEDEQKINEITDDLGFTGKDDMYQVVTEYDGRETLTIKDSIQYKVALSGVIKKQKPEFSEINEILNNAPKHTGVWLEENSKDKILSLLKNITKAKYSIDNEGYLIQKETSSMNEYDEKIKQMITSNNLYIIDISSKYYILDEVTGEVVENPFEDMDPYTPYEMLTSENKEIYFISENEQGKINQEEALKEILE